MNITLSTEHCTIVTATFREVTPVSDTFVHVFYNRLFELKPTVKPLFNSSIYDQGPKLIAILVILLKSLDHLDDLVPAIQANYPMDSQSPSLKIMAQALMWTTTTSYSVSSNVYTVPTSLKALALVWQRCSAS